MRSVHAIAESIVELTEPPEGVFLELMMRARPVTLVCIGLLEQCRRAMQAFMSLTEHDLSDTTSGHTRTVFENTITGLWLLSDPDRNFSLFLGDQRTHIAQSVSYLPEYEALLEQFDSLMDTWVGHLPIDDYLGIG